MKIPSAIAAMIAGIALTLVSLWYGQNHGLMPVAASDEAAKVDGLFNTMMTIATGLFLIVQSALLIAVFRFRRRKDDTADGPPVHGNIPLEILWTAIPAVVVLWISVYSFEVYNSLGGFDPMAAHDHQSMPAQTQTASMPGSAIAATLSDDSNSAADQPHNTQQPKPQRRRQVALGLGASPGSETKAADVLVNVMGLQYAWIFNYPEGVTSGDLHVPVDREVQLNIVAQDVLHAFWLPEFRIKQDAIPGRQAELRFTPRKIGEFPVVCAELCGAYHSAMKTRIFVHTPEEYNSWLQSQLATANHSDPNTTLAANPAALSPSEFLAPYTPDLGIQADTLKQLQAIHHHPEHAANLSDTATVDPASPSV